MSKDKKIVWEGSSKGDIREFPEGVKLDLGRDLRRLQEGKKPSDSKPMTSIAKGVYELRESDQNGWYRVIYYTKIKDQIHVLHCFVKKGKKTPKDDLNTAESRLKNVKKRIKESKK